MKLSRGLNRVLANGELVRKNEGERRPATLGALLNDAVVEIVTLANGDDLVTSTLYTHGSSPSCVVPPAVSAVRGLVVLSEYIVSDESSLDIITILRSSHRTSIQRRVREEPLRA